MENLKSIWIESSWYKPHIFIQLFADYGIPDNHQVYLNANQNNAESLINAIFEADQICFESSFVGESQFLIQNLMNTLVEKGLTGKIIRTPSGLLESLNGLARYRFYSEAWKPLFDNNFVLEINNDDEEAFSSADCWNRIVFDDTQRSDLKYKYIHYKL